MQTFCLALDLRDDPSLISEYEAYHKAVWPEILTGIRESGISRMDIYRAFNRLFMIVEADDHFSFEAKEVADSADPMVQQWEALMWNYQQALPGSKPGEKWVLMQKIFSL